MLHAQPYSVHRDLPYDTIPGVDPNLLRLDVYVPSGATRPLPTVIYVHGGYWSAGDKANVGSKADLFTRSGYAFASVNYRLSPDPPDTGAAGAVRHPIHARDVGRAVAWLHRNAKTCGIDTSRMLLIGHSAGAHLVDIVSTNPRFLEEAGLSLHGIRGTCSLDAGVLDVPWELYQARNLPTRAIPLLNAFGKDTALWIDASPMRQIRRDRSIPPFLIVHQNTSDRVTSSVEFRDSLRANGFIASNFNAEPYDHGDINAQLGATSDSIGLTDTVLAFFARCIGNGADSSTFVVDDASIAVAGVTYLDPEILQDSALVVSLDAGLNAWIGRLNRKTGAFDVGGPRVLRVDTALSQWSLHSNGPEWGLDTSGVAIFYVKDDERGAGQLWRAQPPWDAPRLEQLTRDSLHTWICQPSMHPGLASTRVAVYHGAPGGTDNHDAWLDEDTPAELHRFTDRMVIARWAFNTPFITWAPAPTPSQTEPSQVRLVDTDTRQSRTITDDAGNKIDPWLWHAPEFGGELLLMANIDNRALGIYRDLRKDGSPWTRIDSIMLPADAPHRALKSVEPVNGGAGAFGRSCFTVQAGLDSDSANSIWLFCYSPDGRHLVRRLDEGAMTRQEARRLDPESFVGDNELFVYYTLLGEGQAQFRRCRTGIMRPADTLRPQTPRRVDWFRFTRDFVNGSTDQNGQYMGGTDCMYLTTHKGRLFAGMSYWSEDPARPGPHPGPQILVKESSSSGWRVDRSFGTEFVRTDALYSFVFTKDGQGIPLARPDTLLFASFSDSTRPYVISVWSREDANGTWTDMPVQTGTTSFEVNYVRHMFKHTDQVTGLEHVFAATATSAIYRGSYDAAAPGRIRWAAAPEVTGPARVLSSAEIYGTVYAAFGSDGDSGNGIGGLFKRIDGPSPRWEFLYEWLDTGKTQLGSNIRGLTAVPDPLSGKPMLWGYIENLRTMNLFDPEARTAQVELDPVAYFNDAWYTTPFEWSFLYAAYNETFPFVTPDTKDTVLLMGLWANNPAPVGTPDRSNSWYMARYRNGSYVHGQVIDENLPVPHESGLNATRTICRSPFPEEENTYYFGGFDPGSRNVWRNTGWIYKARVKSPPSSILPLPVESALEVFPNPAATHITVRTAGESDIRITDILGRTLWNGSVAGVHRIDISRLPRGVYIVHAQGNWIRVVKR